MKTVLVYYSLTGNVAYVAEKLAAALHADAVRLEPVRAYPDSGAKKFFWGGKSAVMGGAPTLRPCAFDAAACDCVIFGTPVWAGTFTPPLRTFIRENRAALAGKTLAAFACSSGGGTDKALAKLAAELGVSGFAATLSLVDPMRRADPENERRIADFAAALASAD